MSQYLSEAFKRLDALNEETFSITDNGLEDYVEFQDNDELDTTIDVIDMEAETEEDLEDSYVGKVILDCCVCHSKLYKDVEDVVIDGELANTNEECPFCYTTDGFKVIGQVATFGEESEEEDEEEDLDEGLTRAERHNRHMDRIFQAKKDRDARMSKFLKDNSDITDDELKKVQDDDKIGLELKNRGLHDRYWNEVEGKKESIKESVNNVNVETDDGIVNVSSDETGRVTVTTEPNTSGVSDTDVITPLEPEVQSEISDNVGDGEEIEIDMDEFDEESFDELGEGYLKKVYENVNSFKTSNVSFIKDKLILEGVIKFNSGSSKKTNFIFGIREATKSGKVRFIGENKEIARGRKSFTVTGRVENKKFLSESLNYNYGVRTANGKAQRLYGTVKNKRGK